MKLRSLAIGVTVLASGVVIGTTTQQFASADISSGDRPVLVPIETCRVADTRPAPNTIGPQTAGLGAAASMTIDAQPAPTATTTFQLAPLHSHSTSRHSMPPATRFSRSGQPDRGLPHQQ